MKTLAEIVDDVCEIYQPATSVEADFGKRTWTFEGSFRCGAGDYVIIYRKDFEEWIAAVRDATSARESQMSLDKSKADTP